MKKAIFILILISSTIAFIWSLCWLVNTENKEWEPRIAVVASFTGILSAVSLFMNLNSNKASIKGHKNKIIQRGQGSNDASIDGDGNEVNQ